MKYSAAMYYTHTRAHTHLLLPISIVLFACLVQVKIISTPIKHDHSSQLQYRLLNKKKECKIVTKELSCLLNSVSTGRPAVSAQYGRSCERGEA